jgi:hypothetical protein
MIPGRTAGVADRLSFKISFNPHHVATSILNTSSASDPELPVSAPAQAGKRQFNKIARACYQNFGYRPLP